MVEQYGLEPRLIALMGAPATIDQADHPDRAHLTHFVVKVDGLYVDWANRQFNRDAEHPVISVSHDWDRAARVRGGWGICHSQAADQQFTREVILGEAAAER